MTSFPAHGGPPRTVENAERTNVRHALRTEDLTRSVSDYNYSSPNKRPLHSTSLPEIGLARVRNNDTGSLRTWNRSSSAADGFRRRGSLTPAVERTTQGVGSVHRNENTSSKDLSYGSLSKGTRSCENNLTIAIDSSPYPFRRPLNNSFGAVHTRSENHKGSNNREKVDENGGLSSVELARRLFNLEGFNKNEVASMLYKK